MRVLKKKNKGYRNKDPRFFDKEATIKKNVRSFLRFESKKKLSKRLNK